MYRYLLRMALTFFNSLVIRLRQKTAVYLVEHINIPMKKPTSIRRILLRILLGFFLSIVITATTGVILQKIPTGDYCTNGDAIIYLTGNGFHTDIILPNADGIGYTAYGWGSQVFYLNVPTWDDFTLKVSAQALFTKPDAAMHVRSHSKEGSTWYPVHVNQVQLEYISKQINNSFIRQNNERKAISGHPNYFEAHGKYSALNTCNTWVNSIFKKAGLRSSLYAWTSEAIIQHYR